jgi:hypothetical protein
VGFGYLAFFAASGGFGNCGGFGAACGFDTLGCCGARGLFGFAKSAAHGGVRFVGLMGPCGLGSVAGCGLCCSGGSFCFGLGEQCLFADLLGCTMSQLGAIFAAGGGEVAVLGSVKVGPGVEDGDIFRGVRHCGFIDSVSATRIHCS